MTRNLGYRPDPPKMRAEKPDWDAAEKLGAEPPPVRSINRHLILEVLDQGWQGSCVAHAVLQAVRASHARQEPGVLHPLGSRSWLYYLARKTHHEQDQDSGTFIRAAFEVLNSVGFPPESACPYLLTPDGFRVPPPLDAFRLADGQKAPTEYRRIYESGAARVDAIKRALGQGHLVVFGADIGDSILAGRSTPDRPFDPPVNENIAGGHAMCVVQHEGDVFDVVNSWGVGWNDDGFGYFSADFLAQCARDLWIVSHTPRFWG